MERIYTGPIELGSLLKNIKILYLVIFFNKEEIFVTVINYKKG